MDNEINVILDRTDWIKIGKFLSKNIGKIQNILPVILLLNQLEKNGIMMAELE